MRKYILIIYTLVLTSNLSSQSLLDYSPVWESPALSQKFNFFNSNLIISQFDNNKFGANVSPYRFGLEELNTLRLFYGKNITNFNLAFGINAVSNKLYYEINPTLSANYKFDKVVLGTQLSYSRMQIQGTGAFNALKIDIAAKLQLDENLSAAVLLKNLNDGKFAGNSQSNKSSTVGICYEIENYFTSADVEIRESFGTGFIISGGMKLNDLLKSKLVYKTYPQSISLDVIYLLQSNQLLSSFSYTEKLGFSSTIGYAVEF